MKTFYFVLMVIFAFLAVVILPMALTGQIPPLSH